MKPKIPNLNTLLLAPVLVCPSLSIAVPLTFQMEGADSLGRSASTEIVIETSLLDVQDNGWGLLNNNAVTYLDWHHTNPKSDADFVIDKDRFINNGGEFQGKFDVDGGFLSFRGKFQVPSFGELTSFYFYLESSPATGNEGHSSVVRTGLGSLGRYSWDNISVFGPGSEEVGPILPREEQTNEGEWILEPPEFPVACELQNGLNNCEPTRRARLDPEVAIGYDFRLSDEAPNIESINAPTDIGDGVYDLYLFDEDDKPYDSGQDITGGDEFSFLDILDELEGLRKFSIRGIEPEAMLDPDDGEAFVVDTLFSSPWIEGSVYMKPITINTDDNTNVSVSEPKTLASFLGSLVIIFLFRNGIRRKVG